jgi:hypothetical protein
MKATPSALNCANLAMDVYGYVTVEYPTGPMRKVLQIGIKTEEAA